MTCVLIGIESITVGQIYRWDTGEVIPGTEELELTGGGDFSNLDLTYADLQGASLSGVNLANTNLSSALINGADLKGATMRGFSPQQFYSTASYQTNDLSGIQLHNNDLTGWDLSGQDLSSASLSQGVNGIRSRLVNVNLTEADLSNASLRTADLTDADLSGAVIGRADLREVIGLTQEQFYATQSYQTGDLIGIQLAGNDLSSWDFREQDLRNANFRDANLTNAIWENADLWGADLRRTTGFTPAESSTIRNAILPNQEIHGLNLEVGQHFLLSKSSFPVRGGGEQLKVQHELAIEQGSVLEFDVLFSVGFFDHDQLVVSEDVQPSLGGTLRVSVPFGRVAHVWQQLLAAHFQLFTWNGTLGPDERFSSVELPPGKWDLSLLYETGELILDTAYRGDGDFDVDGEIDARDIDRLAKAVRAASGLSRDLSYDINQDYVVDHYDSKFWLREYKHTWLGDANLDGEFNSGDFVQVFRAGHYEDGIAMNSGWAEGDWNGDGEFDTGDLVFAFQDGGYEQGQLPSESIAVPEPNTSMMLIVGLAVVSRRRFRTAISR